MGIVRFRDSRIGVPRIVGDRCDRVDMGWAEGGRVHGLLSVSGFKKEPFGRLVNRSNAETFAAHSPVSSGPPRNFLSVLHRINVQFYYRDSSSAFSLFSRYRVTKTRVPARFWSRILRICSLFANA